MNEEILEELENVHYENDETIKNVGLINSHKKKKKHKKRKRKDRNSVYSDSPENDSKVKQLIKKSGSPFEEGEIPDSEESENEAPPAIPNNAPMYNDPVTIPIKQKSYEANVSPLYPDSILYNKSSKFDERNSFYKNDYNKRINTQRKETSYSPFDDKFPKNDNDKNNNFNFKNKRFRNETYLEERTKDSVISQSFYQKKHNKSEVVNRFKERSYTPNDNLDLYKRDEINPKRTAPRKEFSKYKDQSPFRKDINNDGFETFENKISPSKNRPFNDQRPYRRNDFGKDSYRSKVEPYSPNKYTERYDSPSSSKATSIRREIKQKFNRKMKADDYSPRLEQYRSYEKSFSPCENSPMYQQAKAMESFDRYEKQTACQQSFDRYEKQTTQHSFDRYEKPTTQHSFDRYEKPTTQHSFDRYEKPTTQQSFDRYQKPTTQQKLFDRYEKDTCRQDSFSPHRDSKYNKDSDENSDREMKKSKRSKKKSNHPLLSELPIKEEAIATFDALSKSEIVEKPRRKRKRFDTPPAEKSNHDSVVAKNEVELSREEKRKARANKRSSRWGDSQCMVSQHLRYEDAKVYSLQLELNEVTANLAQKNYAKEYEAMRKLPDPDPIYGPDGKRVNTKEQRARERLEERKKELMIQLHEIRPDLVQNVDKLMANRVYDKVFIPQEDYPDINFAGLIIGPRGMTQKELEKETDTKIILRGKGSVKVAKMAGTGQSLPGDDEPLHAYITSSKRENLAQAAEKIRKIVKDAIDHPELENELRKNQMKQLAIINGTYRETEGLNKLKMREEINSIVTNTMICSLCGGAGHLPRDCKIGNMSLDPTNANFRDPEYKEFLTSIGKNIESTEVEVPDEKPQGVSNFIKNFVFKT